MVEIQVQNRGLRCEVPIGLEGATANGLPLEFETGPGWEEELSGIQSCKNDAKAKVEELDGDDLDIHFPDLEDWDFTLEDALTSRTPAPAGDWPGTLDPGHTITFRWPPVDDYSLRVDLIGEDGTFPGVDREVDTDGLIAVTVPSNWSYGQVEAFRFTGTVDLPITDPCPVDAQACSTHILFDWLSEPG